MTEVFLSNESRLIKFSLLVLFGTVSMICICYIIYNIIKFPIIRQRFHNQTLIVLVILVLINTIFNIPTTFRFVRVCHSLSQMTLFWFIVFLLEDMFSLIAILFVVFGKLSIIFLLQILSGVKLFLHLNDMF